MKTLDRYIVRTFLQSLLLWFIVLLALRVVVDLFIQMDEFIEHEQLSALQLIGYVLKYYFFQIFLYIMEVGGIIIVVAAVFTVAWMNHTNELTAMLASGVSLHRVVWPIILASMVIGGGIIINQEFVIPNIREQLVRDTDSLEYLKQFQAKPTSDGNLSVWYASQYIPKDKRLVQPMVILRDEQLRYLADFNAARAEPGALTIDGVRQKGWMAWDAFFRREDDSGKAWDQLQKTQAVYTTQITPQRLTRLAEKRFEKENGRAVPEGMQIQQVDDSEASDDHYGMDLYAVTFWPVWKDRKVIGGKLVRPRFTFRANDGRVLVTLIADYAEWKPGAIPAENHWTLTGGRLFNASDLTAEELELRQSGRWQDFMSSGELSALLEMQRATNLRDIRLAKYIRFADPLNRLVMLLLGLPFLLSRQRNLKASALLCLLIVGTFFIFVHVCRYLGLPEFWAAFLPVLIFGPVSVLMLDSIKT